MLKLVYSVVHPLLRFLTTCINNFIKNDINSNKRINDMVMKAETKI